MMMDVALWNYWQININLTMWRFQYLVLLNKRLQIYVVTGNWIHYVGVFPGQYERS